MEQEQQEEIPGWDPINVRYISNLIGENKNARVPQSSKVIYILTFNCGF
jgi:hypothetical protein